MWSWFWDRVVAWLVSLSSFLPCDHSGELYNIARPHPRPCSPNVASSKEQGQFTCSHNLGFYLPALVLRGPALMFCPGEMQGLLSELLHFGRVGPILLRLPLAPAASGKGWGEGVFPSPLPPQGIRGKRRRQLSSSHVHRPDLPVLLSIGSLRYSLNEVQCPISRVLCADFPGCTRREGSVSRWPGTIG